MSYLTDAKLFIRAGKFKSLPFRLALVLSKWEDHADVRADKEQEDSTSIGDEFGKIRSKAAEVALALFDFFVSALGGGCDAPPYQSQNVAARHSYPK